MRQSLSDGTKHGMDDMNIDEIKAKLKDRDDKVFKIVDRYVLDVLELLPTEARIELKSAVMTYVYGSVIAELSVHDAELLVGTVAPTVGLIAKQHHAIRLAEAITAYNVNKPQTDIFVIMNRCLKSIEDVLIEFIKDIVPNVEPDTTMYN